MNSMMPSICLSFRLPWKLGMTGWKPFTTFACGWRTDSRM
jgi:hypothetical protein